MSDGPLSPEEVAHRGFPTAFRGFDTGEVRAYLELVANELRAVAAREKDLNHRLADAEHRAAHPVIDAEALTRALGDEMGRILASARAAAADLEAKAEENAARILREAHDQAQRTRDRAEGMLVERTEEAEAEADKVRRTAAAEASELVEAAKRDAAAATAQAEARGREVVQEAQAARARVLADLSRRRRLLQVQVEQLRAGRERLLESYRLVRSSVDEVAAELERADAEARDAATAAGERATAGDADVEDLAEVLAAFPPRVVAPADTSALMRAEATTRVRPGPDGAADGAASTGEADGAAAPAAPTGAADGAASTGAATGPAEADPAASATGAAEAPEEPESAGEARDEPPVRRLVAVEDPAEPEPVQDRESEPPVPAEHRPSPLRLLRRHRGEAEPGRDAGGTARGPGSDPGRTERPELASVDRQAEPATRATAPPPAPATGTPTDGPTAREPEPAAHEPAATPPRSRAGTPAGEPAARAPEPAAHAPAAVPPIGTGAPGPHRAEPPSGEPTPSRAAGSGAPAEPPAARRSEAARSDREPTPPAGATAPPASPAGGPTLPTPRPGTAVIDALVAGAPAPDTRPAGEASPAAAVDELFARIRAGRADAVAKAHEVLGDGPPPAPEPARRAAAPAGRAAAPETEPEPEPGPGRPTADEEALLQRRDGAVDGIRSRLARKLKRALQDEQNELLDRLRSTRPGAGAQAVLPAAGEHASRYAQAADELLRASAAAGVSFVSSGAEARPRVDDLVGDLAASVAEPLHRALERVLGADHGADPSAVVERIGAVYRECKAQRIEGLAGDAVTAAFSRGALAALPPGASARWVVDDDGRPCPDCDDNALAGPTPSGEEFPTGQRHPPAHAGCRCLLAPAEVAAVNGSA